MRSYPYNRRFVDRRGKYRWLQLAVIVPAVGSVFLHVGAAVWVRAYSWAHRRADLLTDAPVVDTVLAIDVPRPRDPPPKVEPPPPPLAEEVKPKPKPEIPKRAPEIRREPVPETRPAPAPVPAPKLPDPVSAEPATPVAPAAPVSAPPKTDVEPEPPAAPAPSLPATFAGVKADVAGRVVYVVDASGAMTSSLTFVLDELARSVERLDESQLFQVVLFREPPPDSSGEASPGYEMFRAGLVPATRANKDAARAWARTIRPLGKSSPLPGLTAALELKPDLVFLLSRSIQRTGTEPRTANLSLLKTLEDLNPTAPITRKRPAVIKTIQFIDEDPSGLLPAIASRHGDGTGSYRLLSLEELTGR